MRVAGDIDILVKPEQLAEARAILLEMGYQQPVPEEAWDHPFHDMPYYKQAHFPLVLELHWNIEDEKLVNIPYETIWQRAQRLEIKGRDVMVLSPEDTLLYLASNFTKLSNHVFRSLCDITELLNKYHDSLDWEYILKAADTWGIKTAFYYTLIRSRELMGASFPSHVTETLKPKTRRWRFLDWLVSKDYFISNTEMTRFRYETYSLFRSMTMKHGYQRALVVSKYRGGKRLASIRTYVWRILIIAGAVWRGIYGSLFAGSRRYR